MRTGFCWILSVFAHFATGLASSVCWADSSTKNLDDLLARYETSAGAEFTAKNISLYSSMIASVSGDVRADGARLRAGGGYGWYAYNGKRWTGATQDTITFDGRQSWAELLIGYQITLGPWIVKAYAGGIQERNAVNPFDADNPQQGGGVGGKVLIETWLRMGEVAFLQTDASWSGVFDAYSARTRLGYRITPALSAGLDAAISGMSVYGAGRGGLFVRYEWTGGEASIASGAAGDRDGMLGGYGSMAVLLRF